MPPRSKPPRESNGIPSSQRSLQDSFRSSTSHTSSVVEGSLSKKPKLFHSPSQPTLTAGEMFNFSKPNHVDLTTGGGPAIMTAVQKRPVAMARSDPGPKKLVVKNLRKAPRSDPEQYFNQVRSQLDAALSAILVNEKVPYSNEELYRGAENLCKQGRAAPLFKTLCKQCKQGVSSQFQEPLVTQASTLDDTGVLRAVLESWEAWNARLVCHRSR